MKAWYFSREDRKLRYNDNRVIELGATHKVEGKPELCCHGLHASKKLIDALEYAPGPVLWRVELGGDIVVGDDKVVSTERTYIGGGVDVSTELLRFARMCALDVVHLWDAPDIVIEYLKTGNESLRASAMDSARASARDSAMDSARASAWASAWDSAMDSARASAWASAWDSAWASAWDSARASARASAWDSARASQQRRLTSMLSKFIKKEAA